MPPILIILSSLGLPLVMLLLLVGPVYAGAFVGIFWLYGEDASESALNVEYQLNTYPALYSYWMQHGELVGWTDFIIPAFLPITIGLLSGLLFFTLFVRYVRGIFMAA